jgi:hypothetical protein
MPEVNIDPGRIDAILDSERTIFADGALELLEEFGLRDNLLHPALEDPELFGDIPHRYSLPVSIVAMGNEPEIRSGRDRDSWWQFRGGS